MLQVLQWIARLQTPDNHNSQTLQCRLHPAQAFHAQRFVCQATSLLKTRCPTTLLSRPVAHVQQLCGGDRRCGRSWRSSWATRRSAGGRRCRRTASSTSALSPGPTCRATCAPSRLLAVSLSSHGTTLQATCKISWDLMPGARTCCVQPCDLECSRARRTAQRHRCTLDVCSMYGSCVPQLRLASAVTHSKLKLLAASVGPSYSSSCCDGCLAGEAAEVPSH